MSAQSLRSAGMTVVTLSVAGKGIGLVREVVTAAIFGASLAVDLFLAAVTIPVAVGTILYHSLPNAFVPLFSDSDSHSGRNAAWIVALCAAPVSLLLWAVAPILAQVTTEGFSPEARTEAIWLFRIGSASIVFAAAEALLRSRLLAARRFVAAGVSDVWLSTITIAALLIHPEGGARTLAWGYTLGTVAAAFWSLSAVIFEKRAAHPPSASHAPEHAPKLGWIAGVLVTGVAGFLYALIDRRFGSFLSEGSIASLQYASLLASPLLTVCGMALSTAAFPFLARAVQLSDQAEVRRILDRSMRWSLLVGSAATAVLVILGPETASIIFERGAFDAGARTVTGNVARVYGIWLIPAVISTLVARVGRYDVMGLATASAFAYCVIGSIMLALLPRWCLRGVLGGWLKLMMTVVLIVGGIAFLFQSIVLDTSIASWHLLAIIRVGITVVLGGAILLFAGPDLGITELTAWRSKVVKLVFRQSDK
jgi:putative peptidoglycan lipid II flippase